MWLFTERDDSMITPSYLNVQQGHQASFTCQGKKIDWYYKSLDTIPYTQDSKKINIKKVKDKHSGSYFCVVKDKPQYFVAKAELTVSGEKKSNYYS